MDRVVKRVHIKGTMWLLDKTAGLEPEPKALLLKYVSDLEESQKYLAGKLELFFQEVTGAVQKATNCYYCGGQNCEQCR